MICYIPGYICYGSENFGLGSLHGDYVGLADASPQCWVTRRKFHTKCLQMSGATAQNFLALEDLASGICVPLWLAFKVFSFEDLPSVNLCLHSSYVMTAVEEISLNRTALILCFQIST